MMTLKTKEAGGGWGVYFLGNIMSDGIHPNKWVFWTKLYFCGSFNIGIFNLQF